MNNSDNITMLNFLKQYLAIKTVHPKADYQKVIDFFIMQAISDTIDYTVIQLASGFPVLILSLQGTDNRLQALLLNHHMDVVSADQVQWNYPPFEGIVDNGFIYGRGVQDMKALGVLHYCALRELKKEGHLFARTVYMVLVPGEECGGFDGTAQFIKTEQFQTMNIGYVLDEGIPSGIHNTILLAIDERRPLQLKITIDGKSAHASRLMHYNPLHTLVDILHQIKMLHEGSIRKAKNSKTYGAYSSYHSTMIASDGNNKENLNINIIPSSVFAIIDIRCAPDESVMNILNRIHSLIPDDHDHSIRCEVIAAAYEANNSLKNGYLETMIKKTLLENSYVTQSIIFEGASDMRFYRQLGIEAIGCSPFDDKSQLHEINESLSIKSFYSGKDIIKKIVFNMCCKDLA